MSNRFFEALGERVGALSAVRIEGRMFDLASTMVAGYVGGVWGFAYIGDDIVPVLPDNLGDHVHVVSDTNGANVTTDRTSAAIALALLAINHRVWELHAQKADDLMGVCIQAQDALTDVAYSGAADGTAIYQLTD